ncbi:mCG1032464, partial [Mus musculus]
YRQVPASPCNYLRMCNSIAPPLPLINTSPFACIAPSIPLISICTSPFACVFKPWAWLIHFGVLIQLQNGFRVVIRTRPSSLSTPHLVIRRRSPRDPRITGPAGQVTSASQVLGLKLNNFLSLSILDSRKESFCFVVYSLWFLTKLVLHQT